MNKDVAYYSGVSPVLLNMIPREAQAIVDIGCGTGALGVRYKKINPAVFYIGVELNAEAAQIAVTNMDRVICGDIEKLDLSQHNISVQSLDCLIYGDVLEHLYDPESVLKRNIQYLKPGGEVLACIPNIQHWSVIFNLLQGRWDYAKAGLLDSTHIRFFTLHSIKQLFERCGLRIVDLRNQQSKHPESEKVLYNKLLSFLEPGVKELGVDSELFALQVNSFQYIIRAVV